MSDNEFVVEHKGEKVECKYREPPYSTTGVVIDCKLNNGFRALIRVFDTEDHEPYSLDFLKKVVKGFLEEKEIK